MNELQHLSKTDLGELLEAGERVLTATASLTKGGLNIVGECLKGQGEFYQLSHYPQSDVFDTDSQSQYYFHTHRGIGGEYGHFHTFMRAPGMPNTMQPVEYSGEEAWPAGNDALSHLICISMDQNGFPIGLFTTNRWVTAEAWYQAEDVIAMLDLFNVDHAFPNLAVNQWISGMFRLYKAEMTELLLSRDEVVSDWQIKHSDKDVFEDRELEVTSFKLIDVEQKIKAIKQVLTA